MFLCLKPIVWRRIQINRTLNRFLTLSVWDANLQLSIKNIYILNVNQLCQLNRSQNLSLWKQLQWNVTNRLQKFTAKAPLNQKPRLHWTEWTDYSASLPRTSGGAYGRRVARCSGWCVEMTEDLSHPLTSAKLPFNVVWPEGEYCNFSCRIWTRLHSVRVFLI